MRRVARPGLALIAAALVCVACAAPAAELSQASSIRADGGASATAEPTAFPSLTQSSAPIEAPPSASAASGQASIAEVVTTDLVMRSAPGTGPDSEIYSPSLSSPMLLYILDGPVAADGYEWYRAFRFEEFYTDIGLAGPDVGWVAAGGKDGETWIAPWTQACPEPDALELLTRSPYVALACFGDRELSLEGTLGDCPGGGPGVSLFERWCLLVPFGYQAQLPAGFQFHLATPSPLVGQGAPVRITGHYDDPAASTCAGDALDLTPPEVIVLRCRAAFVATEITPTSAP